MFQYQRTLHDGRDVIGQTGRGLLPRPNSNFNPLTESAYHDLWTSTAQRLWSRDTARNHTLTCLINVPAGKGQDLCLCRRLAPSKTGARRW